MIAARGVGRCSLVAAVAGVAALAATHKNPAPPEDERWRELTYGAFGRDCHDDTECDADEEAAADCLDAWDGSMATRTYPGFRGREFLVEEYSPLYECLVLRRRFGGGWSRPPVDAAFHFPPHAGSSRTKHFDEFAFQRQREAVPLAKGDIVKLSCPSTTSSTYVGLPPMRLRQALWSCKLQADKGWFDVSLDEGGNVTGVITSPDQVTSAPCIMAMACGLRFAGLGAVLSF
jgi:hypothetical protein